MGGRVHGCMRRWGRCGSLGVQCACAVCACICACLSRMRMFHRDIDGDSNGTLGTDEIVQQLQKLALPPQKALTVSDTRTCPRTSACTYALMH